MLHRFAPIALFLPCVLVSAAAFAAPEVCKPVPSSCGDNDFVESEQRRLFDCQAGTTVRAITDGKILTITPAAICALEACGTDQCADTGTVVRIQHDAQTFEYRHLGILAPDIEPGELIRKGQAIGAVAQLQCTDRVTFEISGKSADILRSLSAAEYCPCVPNCAKKSCGSDGCGGECGECGLHAVCENGICTCTPTDIIPGSDNQPKMCGDNGCGALVSPGNGSLCSKRSESCQNYQCVDLSLNASTKNCMPKCFDEDGKQVRACGSDGCGGTCGACAPNQVCSESTFQCECIDSCEGRLCGSDSCGNPCGECPKHMTCDEPTGQCKCYLDVFSVDITDCRNKACGETTACGLTCPCIAEEPDDDAAQSATLELRSGGCRAMPAGRQIPAPMMLVFCALAALAARMTRKRRDV